VEKHTTDSWRGGSENMAQQAKIMARIDKIMARTSKIRVLNTRGWIVSMKNWRGALELWRGYRNSWRGPKIPGAAAKILENPGAGTKRVAKIAWLKNHYFRNPTLEKPKSGRQKSRLGGTSSVGPARRLTMGLYHVR
jgi:hypothetical protein